MYTIMRSENLIDRTNETLCKEESSEENQEAYWIKEFSEEVPVLDMPTDYSRIKEQKFSVATTAMETSDVLCQKLRELTERTETSEYMVFLSVAMILLSKYSGQDDIVIGSPVSTRTCQDIDKTVSSTSVNMLAMRGSPAGGKWYNEFLMELKEKCRKAYKNREYPFKKWLHQLRTRDVLPQNLLFRVYLTYQNLKELSVRSEDNNINSKESLKFDLFFLIKDLGDKYEVGLEYSQNLYDKETARQLIEHYMVILNQITDNSDQYIKEIDQLIIVKEVFEKI